MSEMVDRIADAVADIFKGTTHSGWSSTEYPALDVERIAIVALLEMMEPTNAMLGEAAKAMSPGKRPTPDRVSVKEKHRIRYQAMIRKALDDE